MKVLRLWLLLLLAVLLPIRGAIAAASPCAGDGRPQHMSQAQAHGHGLHHHMHPLSHADEHASAHARHEHGDADKCNLCASCCTAATLPASFSPSIAALEEACASFAVFQASAPTFLSDGQERPPRSL